MVGSDSDRLGAKVPFGLVSSLDALMVTVSIVFTYFSFLCLFIVVLMVEKSCLTIASMSANCDTDYADVSYDYSEIGRVGRI
jgi:hypothetical protein